ncbi:hypothetical protein [Pseudorhodoferax sp. Leaf267]|uniref:hypothetical protein n=1 Tax=Pseudorhodoferax sp. Leaf267 TaxID=1736316 RepID=UPI0006FE0864|nr:hypothetical protein [Pseudorhodoferax sp. Leaf267]KQP11867.1 hypothetical protein ASF43_23220 [Pseudorhodoferax sp. Leaf267]
MNASLFPRRATQAIALAVALSLAGCETMPSMPGFGNQNQVPLTAAEQQMQQDESRFNDTVISGVLTGALTGALVGGLGALALGGNSKNARNAAIGGAVVGATALGVDAYVTAKKEQAGRQQVRAAQAAAADVRQDSAKLQSYLDSSGRVLAEGRSRLASLQRDVAAKKLSAEEVQQARAREERNIASMNQTLNQARKTRDQYIEASGKLTDTPQNKRDLDNEIRRMNQQIAQLENNVQAYNQALAVSKA